MDPCIIVQFIKKNPTRCNNVSKFYYFMFIWSSACFGQHTAHHQEPKTALAASGFSYVKGCWMCRWWTPFTRPTTSHTWKTRGCQCSFRLLMMGGMSPETCWASYKHRKITFWYIVASCWIFLYEFMCDTYKCVDLTLMWSSEGFYKNFQGLEFCNRHIILTLRQLMSYIYDVSSLKVNNLTLILLTWRKWWAPNNASK